MGNKMSIVKCMSDLHFAIHEVKKLEENTQKTVLEIDDLLSYGKTNHYISQNMDEPFYTACSKLMAKKILEQASEIEMKTKTLALSTKTIFDLLEKVFDDLDQTMEDYTNI